MIAGLGHGGMADVFLAVACGPVGFNKLQVIKRLRPNLADEAEFVAMFLDEARLAARLNHPNVVQTNEVGQDAGHFFIAMEYLEGQPLSRIIQRSRRPDGLPIDFFLFILAEALAGLHAAHELVDYDGTPLQVIHRDASPHNLFVTYEGQTKLLDFGIAKAATHSSETRAGLLKGKIGYMAPEQARGERLDRRADVFAIGVAIWEIVAGRRLWEGCAEAEILRRLVSGQLPLLAEVCPDAPDRLVRICSRAMAPDAADRYSTAAEMRDDLDAYLKEKEAAASAKDLGKALAILFEDKRADVRRTIEKQIGKLSAAAFEPPDLSIADLHSGATSATPSSHRSRLIPSSSRKEKRRSDPGARSVSSQRAEVASPDSDAGKEKARMRGGMILGAAILGGGWWVMSMPAPAATTGATISEPQNSIETVQSATIVSQVDVRLSATPLDAILYFDNVRLPENPFRASYPRDGSVHQVRAELSGYQTQTAEVALNREVSLVLKLERVPDERTPIPKPKAAPAASTPPAQKSKTAGLPGKPAKRPIDGSDPWSN